MLIISEQLESVNFLPKASGISILSTACLIIVLPVIVVAVHGTDSVLCFLTAAIRGNIDHLDSINRLTVSGISIYRISPVEPGHIWQPLSTQYMNTVFDFSHVTHYGNVCDRLAPDSCIVCKILYGWIRFPPGFHAVGKYYCRIIVSS